MFESINTEAVKVLVLDNELRDKTMVAEMINLLFRFPKLEWIILRNFNLVVYDLIVHILSNHEDIIIDVRTSQANLRKSEYRDKLIKPLRDIVCNRLLLFWCDDCRDNFFSDDPNKCDKCNIISCKSCHSKCVLNNFGCYDPPLAYYPTEEI